jgi:hypothetical protein
LKAHPKQLWDSGIGGLLKPGKCEFAFTVVANTYDDAGFRTTNRVRGMMTRSEDGLSGNWSNDGRHFRHNRPSHTSENRDVHRHMGRCGAILKP